MADQNPQHQAERMKAPFPAPPPFYKHFTKQNLSELRKIRKEAGLPTDHALTPTQDTQASTLALDLLALPTELRYLIPPSPPASRTHRSFGQARPLSAPPPTLSDPELNIEQLYPSHPNITLNPQTHLISLARSHLTTFLLLIGNLSVDASGGWEAPTRDLEVLVFNMLELINGYRPHQARETLILGMEERVRRVRGEIEGVRVGRERLVGLLGDVEVGGGGGGGGSREEGIGGRGGEEGENERVESEKGVERRKRDQKAAWETLGQLQQI
ncbi:hypothetical protein LTR62_003435 [Meristemomyces frigidus]|uniref:Mediator of RNA polymerase II transcription subunit 7 n=1 Tax=Meristemomyces frigidus TaxID=1508187 RepID=A0AAN7YPM7_9PEZI|nr:hypothetical protein LTR62_003435 [Meristemomyces frigidus]